MDVEFQKRHGKLILLVILGKSLFLQYTMGDKSIWFTSLKSKTSK